MGNHVDSRGKKGTLREHDEQARHRRATFKQYLRNIEEDLLEDDLADADPIDEDSEED